MGSPLVTIFVRHADDCKHRKDEQYKRCDCRKHLRWSTSSGQQRQSAGTRDWAEAERVKRGLEDQLSGRVQIAPVESTARPITDAITGFLAARRVEGVSVGVLARYETELGRMAAFLAATGVYTLQAVTRDGLVRYAETWSRYASGNTRKQVRMRCRSFFHYCHQVKWMADSLTLPKVKADEPVTMPLTDDEFNRLLAATAGLPGISGKKVRALFLLMRWSGLAIRDALMIKREQIFKVGTYYKVVTNRQKTGVDVSVPVRADIAEEILAVEGAAEGFVFWNGNINPAYIGQAWATQWVRPAFQAAAIPSSGHMVSHRLRDTFAVDLLVKGVPIAEVSKMLGHASITVTETHYAKWVKGRQDRLDSLVIGTWAA